MNSKVLLFIAFLIGIVASSDGCRAQSNASNKVQKKATATQGTGYSAMDTQRTLTPAASYIYRIEEKCKKPMNAADRRELAAMVDSLSIALRRETKTNFKFVPNP